MLHQGFVEVMKFSLIRFVVRGGARRPEAQEWHTALGGEARYLGCYRSERSLHGDCGGDCRAEAALENRTERIAFSVLCSPDRPLLAHGLTMSSTELEPPA